MASILARIWCLSGVLFIKKTITVVLILLLSLSIIFSAPAGLFLFNAKAQSINNNLPRLSLPPISVTGKTIPSIPSSPIQTASNGINVPSNNPTIHTNFNIQTPIRSAGSTTTTPIIPTRISPVLNPNQQLQQQQQGRVCPNT